jgi:molybdopterin-guanine dinucleotide biosynthesis protein A
VEREILTESNSAPLFGLVLAGGFSTRMLQDKAKLKFGEKYMYQVAMDVLRQVCDEVYLSCRSEQCSELDDVAIIPDELSSRGPITGILSAQKFNPQVAWLVIPVDMPYLNEKFIKNNLIAGRDHLKDATVLKDKQGSFLQPLVAIYEPSSHLFLREGFNANIYSLKAALNLMKIEVVEVEDPQHCLNNYNFPEDWK